MDKTKEIIELLKTLPCTKDRSFIRCRIKSLPSIKDKAYYVFDKDIYQLAKEINQLYNDWPKEGDRFWFFDGDGMICHENYSSMEWKKNSLNFGNFFKTEKEAIEARDRVKQFLNELR